MVGCKDLIDALLSSHNDTETCQLSRLFPNATKERYRQKSAASQGAKIVIVAFGQIGYARIHGNLLDVIQQGPPLIFVQPGFERSGQ